MGLRIGIAATEGRDGSHARTHDMRTRTFIGLILLVIALMVASTPALLTPASKGVDSLLTEAGTPGFEKPVTTKAKKTKIKSTPGYLELKGHVDSGKSLTDIYSTTERGSNQTGRLEMGSSRAPLPGQLEGTDAYDDPIAYNDKGEPLPRLDKDKCPKFQPGDDVAAIWANADQKAALEALVAASADPATCTKTLAARRAQALAAADDWDLPGDRRTVMGLTQGSTESYALGGEFLLMFEDMFGDLGDLFDAAKATRDDQL